MPAIKVIGFSVIATQVAHMMVTLFLSTSKRTIIANRLLQKSQMKTLEYDLAGYRHDLDFLGHHLVQLEHDSDSDD